MELLTRLTNSDSDIGDSDTGFIIQFCAFENLYNKKF